MYNWLAFAALAIAACAAAWRDFELRPVGIAIVGSWAASNAAHYWIAPLERPAAYTVAEAMVLSMAFLAHVCGASRLLVALVAVCVVSIGLNVHMTMHLRPTLAQIHSWELATNLCFSVECSLVICAGLHERLHRTFDRVAHGRFGAALHGRSTNPTEADR